MGMSAAQARLLSITARLTDNEMRSQLITNSKLRLADKSSEASRDYMAALNDTQFTYVSYDQNGLRTNQLLTPSILTSYGELKNQYGIVNSQGQLLVSSQDFNNYTNSATLNDFLAKYGLEETLLNKNTLDEYDKKLKEIIPDTTFEELKATDDGTEAAIELKTNEINAEIKELENKKFVDEPPTSDKFPDELKCEAYSDIPNFENKISDIENGYSTWATEYNNYLASIKETNPELAEKLKRPGLNFDSFNETEPTMKDVDGTYYFNDVSGHPEYFSNEWNRLASEFENMDFYSGWTSETIEYMGQVANMLAAMIFGCDHTTLQHDESYQGILDQIYGYDYRMSTINFEDIAAELGVPENKGYYGTGALTSIKWHRADRRPSDIHGSVPLIYGDKSIYANYASDPGFVDFMNNITNEQKVAIIDAFAYIMEAFDLLYVVEGKTTFNTYDSKGYDELAVDVKYKEDPSDPENPENIKDPRKVEIGEDCFYESLSQWIADRGMVDPSDFSNKIKDAFDSTSPVGKYKKKLQEYKNNKYNWAQNQCTKYNTFKQQYDALFTIYAEAKEAFDNDIKTQIEALKTELENAINDLRNKQTEAQNLLQKIMDSIGLRPEENYGFNTGNPKYQWYKNLWYRMGGIDENTKSTVNKCKELDSNLMNNAEWIQFALEHGVITLEQVSFNEKGSITYPKMGTYDWTSIEYGNAADISTTQNEIAIAKAETKYKNALNEIEIEDKKYDSDLKRLETEHTALQTEYDSVKSVIDKNVERSFKAFS